MADFFGEPTRGQRGWARPVGVAVVTAILFWGAPAFSQNVDIKPLLDRIQRLERDIRTLNSQTSRSGGPAGAAATPVDIGSMPESQQTTARMEVRLTSLEAEVRAATGRSEEVSHQLEQVNQRLDKLIGDVDYRLSVLERNQAAAQAQGGQGLPAAGAPNLSAVPAPLAVERQRTGAAGPAFATTATTLGTLSGQDMEKFQEGEAIASQEAPPAPAQQAAAAPGVLPEGTPKEQYTYAFDLLRQGRYDDAEVALGAFIKAHGEHALAGNARYWLGETFYVRGDFIRAAEIFLGAYQDNPKDPKAPDTLLKLGMSLANLDKKREACAAFGKLEAEYADAPANIKRLVEREQTQNACN